MDINEQQLRRLEQKADSSDLRAALAASRQLVKALKRPARQAPGEYAARATAAIVAHARNLSRAARHYRGIDDLQRLVAYGRPAARLLRKLARRGTDAPDLLAQTLADLAYGYVRLGSAGRAARANREAAVLYQGLAKYDRPRYLGDLASVYYTGSMILGESRQFREALLHGEWSADLYQEAARINPAENQGRYELALDSLLRNVREFGTHQDRLRIKNKHG